MRNLATQREHILRCPACGFTFDISYGRAFACGGCSSLVQCNMAKCPKCGHEFQLSGQYGTASKKYRQRF